MSKLNVHLITWNGSKYIEFLFDSLRKQTFKDWKLVILDNASGDDTVEKIKLELKNFPFDCELVENKDNKGFAGGHNQLWTTDYGLQTMDYVLLLNQDMYLMPDCIERMVKFMDEHMDAAAVSPRLMKWNFNRLQTSDFRLQDSFTNKIDSLGLKIFRNRRVIELGAGQDISNFKFQISNFQEVFGVSGALPLFRKSVIDRIGLFDESFGSYKEDVDLAYRLQSAGYKAYTILEAVAYHDRSAAGPINLNDKTALDNKKNQSEWVRYHSYKNHLMTLIKNEYWQNYILDLPWIKWYELKKFVYFLLFDRQVLAGLKEIWQLRKDLRIKRLKIKELRKLDWKRMRDIFKKY